MSSVSIPSNLARVSNQLASQIFIGSLNGTSKSLLEVQIQLASGLRVNRASDDVLATSTISVLDDKIERREQRVRNLQNAEGLLNNVDAALADVSNILLEAKSIGLSQIGITSDAETRANQAEVVNSMLDALSNIANRTYQDIHLFGGSNTDSSPYESLLGGLRYGGEGGGLSADLGFSLNSSLTLPGQAAFGATSARITGSRDLNPSLTPNTRISDLNGARGLGVNLSAVNIDVDGTDITVDLSGAHRVQDVLDILQEEIREIDEAALVTISPGGDSIVIAPTTGSITVTDLSGDGAAADLGINRTFVTGAGDEGFDIDPRVTDQTPISALFGVTTPLGTIRIENAGQTRDLDLSGVSTIRDLKNAVAGLNLGVRVDINDAGDRVSFLNELSGGQMSIGEVGGGNTATQLGVRSFSLATELNDLNDGFGVRIRSGSVDAISGAPDPAADIDFRVTLKDGRTFDVDLAGATDIKDVIVGIQTAATSAGVAVPGEFDVDFVADGNGLLITDNTAGTDTSITALNGSFAAEDLGILGTTSSATLTGEDRAKIAVDSVFSNLIALRDALAADDERGISIATQRLENDIQRATRARASNGVRSRRVADAIQTEEDGNIQDRSLRSQVQDLDYTEAATRFTALQQQLQAGLTTASRLSSLSLLDFL